jgi:modification methylase
MNMNNIEINDALAVLKTLPDSIFDAGVTSPPYNKGERHEGWLVDNVLYDSANDQKSEAQYQQEQVDVLNEIYRITKPGGSFFYNHKLRWERGVLLHPYSWVSRTKWAVRQEIIWHRHIAANIRGWRFWQVEERIYWLYKPLPAKGLIGTEIAPRHALLTSVWDIRPDQNPLHPNPFPIELPTRCIYSVLDGSHGIVLDPYAGIGTTLVVAKLLGCDYFGIEISPSYARLAEERLANAEKERFRVLEELNKHQVELTFKERKACGIAAPPHKKERRQQPLLLG